MADMITGAPSSGDAPDQFIVLCGQIIGNGADGFQTIYGWDGEIHADRKSAISAGWKDRESDDFNIGVIRDGRLVSLDWMDEPLGEAPDTLIEIEEQIDWRDPRDTFEVRQEADNLQQGGDESDFAWIARLRARFAPPSEALAQAVAAARAEGRAAGLEEAARIADDWLKVWGDRRPVHVSAQTWANGAVRDIAEVIREARPTTVQTDTEKSASGYEVCEPIHDEDGSTTLTASYTPNNGIRLRSECAVDDDADFVGSVEMDLNREQARQLGERLIRWADHNHGYTDTASPAGGGQA